MAEREGDAMSGRRLAWIVLVLLALGALVAARLRVNPSPALPAPAGGTRAVGRAGGEGGAQRR